MSFINWLRRVLNKMGQMLVQGSIIRAAGDTDEFDVIDHKTGKPK
jgi:hypothetical protein